MPHPPRTITADGMTRTLAEWCAVTGLSAKTLCSRLDVLGWTPERAVSVPPDRRFRRGGRPRAGEPRAAPKLRRAGGRAFVRWTANGRDHFQAMGAWGSAEATAAYRRFAGEWAAGAHEPVAAGTPAGAETVAGLLLKWLGHVQRDYRKLGKHTSEYHVARAVAKTVNRMYGDTLAGDFGPAQLRAVRAAWVKDGKTRKTVNGYAYRVVRCWRWGASESLVPPAVHHALASVENLKPGRTTAPDRQKVQPVDDLALGATLGAIPGNPHGRTLSAMIRVQRLTGLRPQHLTEMRAGDIDRAGEVWRYVPPAAGTKTYHLSKRPAFYFGPKVQAELAPLLDGKGAADHVFTYRQKGARVYRISRAGYCKGVTAACKRAGVAPWHPHQLRHSLATEVAERFGLDAAAGVIGDAVRTAREVYVHHDPRELQKIEVAKQMG